MNVSENLLLLADSSAQLYFSYKISEDRFDYLNPAFKEFFDIKVLSPPFPGLLALIHPEDQIYITDQVNACLMGQALEKIECRIVNGTLVRQLRISARLLSGLSELTLIGYADDITDDKTQLEIISKHNAKKNSVLSIVAHDLAGPIGNMHNLAELLRREAAKWQSSSADDYINLMSRISKNCINLIRNFLDHEFLESTGGTLVKKRVNLIEKIKVQTEQYLKYQIELNKVITYTFNQPEIFIEIDEDKFLQVINNLLSNAIKFTKDGGTINVGIEDQAQSVLIKIADNGIGIPKKFHDTLFEKFSLARRPGLKGEQSTGLGMSIIKTIVEWHDGKIWVESEEKKGSTFFIELPKKTSLDKTN